MSKGFVALQKFGMNYLLKSNGIYKGIEEKFEEYNRQVCNVS